MSGARSCERNGAAGAARTSRSSTPAEAKALARRLVVQASRIEKAAEGLRLAEFATGDDSERSTTASVRLVGAIDVGGDHMLEAAWTGLVPELLPLVRWVDSDGRAKESFNGRPLANPPDDPRGARTVAGGLNALYLASAASVPTLDYAPRPLANSARAIRLALDESQASRPSPAGLGAEAWAEHEERCADFLLSLAGFLERWAERPRRAAADGTKASEYRPPTWFQRATNGKLRADSLRKAITSRNLEARGIARNHEGRWFLPVDWVLSKWPAYRKLIGEALAADAKAAQNGTLRDSTGLRGSD